MTLRQVFIRVYRLEIQSDMLVFLAQLFELLPSSLTFSLVQLPPPLSPLPPVNTYCILYKRIQCVRGGLKQMTKFCIVFSESCLSTGRKEDAEYNRRLV
jgi:hypothetical protein